jgi:glycosyltransferase involved in cell wall biosynthesis
MLFLKEVERGNSLMIFSVVVPFLNEEAYIERCIKALLNQDFNGGERELIFVDNGSTDRSAAIVQDYPELILLRDPAPNVYAARNKALAVAKGEIIAFTDADSEVSPDWLSQIHRGMKETGAVIALGRRFFPPDSSAPLRILEDYENAKTKYLLAHASPKYYFGFAGNMAVRASLFHELGGFREEKWILGDTEIVQRCVSKHSGASVIYLPGMDAVHWEITSACTWFSKLFLYGRYNRYAKNADNDYTELGLRERLAIFRYLVQAYRYSFSKSLLAIFVLATGSFYYAAGQVASLFLETGKLGRK